MADDLSEAQAKARLKMLSQEIRIADSQYYGDDAPTLSDAAYDSLRKELLELEERLRFLFSSCTLLWS